MSTRHWRSVRDLREGEKGRPEQLREFSVDDPARLDLDRRSFMGLVGASAALAGTLQGCLRKDVEHILPYADRPEDLIPGHPRFYRTAMAIGDSVVGLHVASVDGRPIKVEGNPDHPMSRGATNRWNQASVIHLYDPDRSQKPLKKGQEVPQSEAVAFLAGLLGTYQGGGGFGVLVDGTPSPTLWRMLSQLQAAHPQASLYQHDVSFNRAQAEGLAGVGLAGHGVHYDLSQADVVLVLDADVFGGEGDTVSLTKGFTQKRKVSAPGQAMNRLFVVEPRFTATGAMADNRLRVPGSHVGEFLRGVGGAIITDAAPAALRKEVVDRQKTEPGGLAWSDRFAQFVAEVGKDLKAAAGRSAVIVGERQPAWAHALAAAINAELGNVGKTVFYTALGRPTLGTVEALAADLDAGKLRALVILGGSPVYDAPGDLDLAARLAKVETVVHLGYYVDETSKLAAWHLPLSHSLEAWGDLVSSDGTVAVQQPLIAPLWESAQSPLEVLARLLGNPNPDTYALVKETSGQDDLGWRRAVHDGIAKKGEPGAAPTFDWSGLPALCAADKGPTRPTARALELDFVRDSAVLDGRYANTGWLQELPDPISKLTWDNAAFLSPATAKELGLSDSGTPVSAVEVTGELIEVSLNGRTVKIVAWVLPGVADNVVVLPLGFGRDLGFISKGAGFDVTPIRPAATPWVAYGGVIKPLGERYVVATTQEYGLMVEPLTGVKRPVVREASNEGYSKDPGQFTRLVKDGGPELMTAESNVSLWVPPNATGGQQWGMTIDLNTCTGCNVCTIACQSENNIPIVGKERVSNGREMHWIRLDRYFTGSEDEPSAVVQPMACAQCEMAPCENVCPVAATTHSPEGLNDMAYNRCIGTRYCTNNCPFKVRRFNFFNYNKEREQKAPLEGMQHNPNVTVRFRGVVEKCTYCVQRINEAKIAVKRQGQSVVPDGAIVPACAQACPADAILFGDINDPKSRVSLAKTEPRNYEVLRELNLHARTSYLAKLRNPNPALQPKGA